MNAEQSIDNEAYLLSLDPEKLGAEDSRRLIELFGDMNEAMAYREFLLEAREALQAVSTVHPPEHILTNLRSLVLKNRIFRNGFTSSPFLSRLYLPFSWHYSAAAVILFLVVLSIRVNPDVHPNQALMADTAAVNKPAVDTSFSKGSN